MSTINRFTIESQSKVDRNASTAQQREQNIKEEKKKNPYQDIWNEHARLWYEPFEPENRNAAAKRIVKLLIPIIGHKIKIMDCNIY